MILEPNVDTIEIDVMTSEVIATNSNYRFVLGYLSGEFEQIYTEGELFVAVYFKRNEMMEEESIRFTLNNFDKIFKQKLPPVSVISFYMRLFGWIKDTDQLEINLPLKCSVKRIPVGKFGGKHLAVWS